MRFDGAPALRLTLQPLSPTLSLWERGAVGRG
jgi:hypothetical protein